MSTNSVRAWLPYLAAFAIGASQLPVLAALRTVLAGKTRTGGFQNFIFAAAFWIGMLELLALMLAGLWLWYRAHRRPAPRHWHVGHGY